MTFYALSDDIGLAKKKLTKANPNNKYKIVYPGDGNTSIPGNGQMFCSYTIPRI